MKKRKWLEKKRSSVPDYILLGLLFLGALAAAFVYILYIIHKD